VSVDTWSNRNSWLCRLAVGELNASNTWACIFSLPQCYTMPKRPALKREERGISLPREPAGSLRRDLQRHCRERLQLKESCHGHEPALKVTFSYLWGDWSLDTANHDGKSGFLQNERSSSRALRVSVSPCSRYSSSVRCLNTNFFDLKRFFIFLERNENN